MALRGRRRATVERVGTYLRATRRFTDSLPALATHTVVTTPTGELTHRK